MSDKQYNTGRRLSAAAYRQFPHLVAAGFTNTALANFFDIAPSTVWHIMKKLNLKQRHEDQTLEDFFGIVDVSQEQQGLATKSKRKSSRIEKKDKPAAMEVALAMASDGSPMYAQLPLHWRNKMNIFAFEEFLAICTKPNERLLWAKKHGFTEQFATLLWHFVRPKLKA